MNSSKIGNLASWSLVLCALIVTTLVVRRELIHVAAAKAKPTAQPVFIESWRAGLEHGIRSGRAEAPVQLLEFTDFECPACARFESTIRSVLQRYPEKVAVVLAHSPLPMHPHAEAAAHAAECAHAQGRFDAIRAILFEQQRSFGQKSWSQLAREAGVGDLHAFEACIADTGEVPRIAQGKRLAREFGIPGTPTILINGWRLPAPPSPDELDKMITRILADKAPVSQDPPSFWSRLFS